MKREGEAILFDVSALFDKVIDESINEGAVSWNSVAREDDGIAWDDADILMFATGNP